MNPRELLEASYRAALIATDPAVLTRRHLPPVKPDAVLAVGKAAPGMLGAALSAFPGVPYLAVLPGGLELAEHPGGQLIVAGHPVPDQGSVQAAQAALGLAAGLNAQQRLLVLISGGGSALMSAPWGVTLEQKQVLTAALLASGASIGELNTVRRHLSRVKGGRLAAATRSRVTALLLSDVVGDDPATIASGPTVPDPSTFADALDVLNSHHIAAPAARAHLERGVRGEVGETPKPDQWPGDRVSSQVIGSGRLMTGAARRFLEAQGVKVTLLGEQTGEASALATSLAGQIRAVRQGGGGPMVLLWGGETTVTLGQTPGLDGDSLDGNSLGGRNHECALALLLELRQEGVYALLAGTDGQDGNSGAAGAFLTPDSWARAQGLGLDARDALRRHDSGTFFASLRDQLVTGPSGTNLNDFGAVWVDRCTEVP